MKAHDVRSFHPGQVATGRGGGAEKGAFESRVSEGAFQATAVLVHALAPAVFAGYLASALRSPIGNAATRRALALQAASPDPNPSPSPNPSTSPSPSPSPNPKPKQLAAKEAAHQADQARGPP